MVGGLASPVQGDAVVRTIRTRSSQPIRWFVLYAHHPDMQFGAIAMKRAGASIIAHPDANILAAEGGPDQMVADWDQVVGLQEMLGFEFANVPDRAVTGSRHAAAGQAAGGRVASRERALAGRPDALAARRRDTLQLVTCWWRTA